METEKDTDRYLKREIKKRGGWCLKWAPVHVSGLPDRICLMPGGRIFFAEVKGQGEKPRQIQIFVCNKIKRLGFRVEIVDTQKQVDTILADYE